MLKFLVRKETQECSEAKSKSINITLALPKLYSVIQQDHLRHSGIGSPPVLCLLENNYSNIKWCGLYNCFSCSAQASLPGRIDVLSYKGRKRGLDLNSSTLFRHKSFYCREVERWGN